MSTKNTESIILAVDGIYGRYVYKRFFERFPQFLERIEPSERHIVTDPDHQDYCDVWDDFYRDFEVMKDGIRWYLFEDGDIYFVSEDYNWDSN